METSPPQSFGRELWGRRYAVVYLALLIRFGIEVARWHDPHTGWSPLICFGEQFAPRRVAALADVPLYTYAYSGYDGQFYAQIAVAGNPFDPALAAALDSPGYRTRRILLPALAHLAGLGRPAWIIDAYALGNLLCFLILAALLARWWFPPIDLHNLLRWVGTLFGAGMMVSVTRSLSDGPALLVIAIGARLVEKNRRLLGAAILGAAGLARETSVLCAAAFAPTTPTERRAWSRVALAGLLCLAPTLLWGALLARHYGGGAGSRNFDLPFVSFGKKLAEIYRLCRSGGFDPHARTEIFSVVAVGAQVGLLLLRPRLELLWWRIGAAFSLLWIFLGWAVWEGSPSAMARAVLPLTLSFNLLAPRTRRGLLLLLMGNLTVLSAFDILQSNPSEQTTFERGVTVRYQTGWQGPEHRGPHTWRWASGPAELALHNPTPQPLRATLTFDLASVTPRRVTLHAGGAASDGDQVVVLAAQKRIAEHYGPFWLPPGDTALSFTSAEAPWVESVSSKRPLTFSIHNLTLELAPAQVAAPP